MATLLEQLRGMTTVVADSGDINSIMQFKPTDLPDRVNYEKLARVSRWIRDLTERLADDPAGPAWDPLPGTDLVVKLGPAGVRAGGRVHPAAPADPVDPTGAGDAFAAGYLLGGVTLGLEAAARAVAVLGAMP